ncbi:MAG: UDP-N-acetylmuramoyl-L-alanyl-D-glutamate--2,6-diaminopimelate ligase [Methylophaga sp.]|nr:MAG: UDP-N-acetylmuramoyl-L-alanyl-D-glutamate--2,6-diaminopimelate ligase [Methylophaga sp.]
MITVSKQSLNSLLAGMVADPAVLEDIQLSAISLDSRYVVAGSLFLSLSADQLQRLNYLEQAIALGASVVLYEQEHDLTSSEITALAKQNIAAYAVKDLASKAGEIAARFYGHPSMALTVIAITGTNGKTSVSQFIAQSLELLGFPCGIIGTLGVGRLEHLSDTGMTTPDPVILQGVLADFCQQNINYVVIEASSHALDQGRLNNVMVDVAVLTNLTRDHLDYHKNMANYAAAKARLFSFPSVKTAIINSTDSFGQSLINTLSATKAVKVWSYSTHDAAAKFYAKNSQATRQGVQFELVSNVGEAIITSPLLGFFNNENLLATIASLLAIEIPFEDIIAVIEQCHSVEGRMQCYGNKQQTQLVIDFAHTPDALTQALQSLRAHVPAAGQLWCVFGCGGDRDAGKRSAMGRSAERYADKLIVTDDNPRSEDPAQIVSDILSGVTAVDNVHIEHDRKLAIEYAVSQASSDDIVLVAGKGHEQYQEIAGVKQPFSDVAVVMEALAANDKHDHNITVGA